MENRNRGGTTKELLRRPEGESLRKASDVSLQRATAGASAVKLTADSLLRWEQVCGKFNQRRR